MRKVLLSCMLLQCLYAKAQTEPYIGGFGDGNSMSDLITYSDANPSMFYAYFGGAGDGCSDASFNLYNDTNPPIFYAYFGGNGDGNADNDVLPHTDANPPMFYAYFGGNGDGFGGDLNAAYPDANPPMFYAYFGGNGDGYAGDLLLMFIPSALPVQLISFEGKALENQSLLQWKAALEKDLSHYDLQRSSNCNSYQTIYTEKITNPSSAEKIYSYTDVLPLEGPNYYRLRINDLNGKSNFSQVVLLYFKHGSESLSIYPNPALQTLNVQYIAPSKAKLRVLDMRGNLLLEKNLEQGSSISNISIGHLAAGSYLMQVIGDNGFNKSIRFVKL